MFLRVALFASVAALLTAADLPKLTNLTVHEWGTFTTIAGADGSSLDWDSLVCANDLPGFVTTQRYGYLKARLMGTVRMETPVMYFYSARPVTAHVLVRFPHGVMTEWFPIADNAIYQNESRLPANLKGIDLSLHKPSSTIEWKNIQIEPGSTPVYPTESAPSRYYAARQTDASPITVAGQHEKFLFYRGVGRFDIPLSARIADDEKIAIKNLTADPVPGVIVFENRGGRIGFRQVAGSATIERPALNNTFADLQNVLEANLRAQGLYAKEAHAMVETWRDTWFGEGSRVLYIVPAKLIDAVLPAQIDPAPAEVNRVFVGRIELNYKGCN